MKSCHISCFITPCPSPLAQGLSWNLELSGRQQALQTPLATDSHRSQHWGYRVLAVQPQPHTQLCAAVWPELRSLGLHARCSSVLMHPPSAPPAAVPAVGANSQLMKCPENIWPVLAVVAHAYKLNIGNSSPWHLYWGRDTIWKKSEQREKCLTQPICTLPEFRRPSLNDCITFIHFLDTIFPRLDGKCLPHKCDSQCLHLRKPLGVVVWGQSESWGVW